MTKRLSCVVLAVLVAIFSLSARAANWDGTKQAWDFSSGPLTYKLYNKKAPAGWKDAVREAIEEWDDLICHTVNFLEVTDCTKTGDIYIGWPLGEDDGSGGVTEPLPVSKPGQRDPRDDTWAENDNAWGLTCLLIPPDGQNEPYEVDFNPHHAWRTDLSKPSGGSHKDLVDTAKHEWGHVLGLDDTYLAADSWRMMYGIGDPGTRKIVTYSDVGPALKALSYDVHLQKPKPASDEYDILWDGTKWTEKGYYADLYDDPQWKDENKTVRIDNLWLRDYFKTVWLLVKYEAAQPAVEPNITLLTASGAGTTRTIWHWSDDGKELLMSFWLPDQPEWEEIRFSNTDFYTMKGIEKWDVATYCSYLVPEPGTMGILAMGGLGLLIRRRRRRRAA